MDRPLSTLMNFCVSQTKKNLSFFCYDIANSKLRQIIKVGSKYFLAYVLIQLVKFLDPPPFFSASPLRSVFVPGSHAAQGGSELAV